MASALKKNCKSMFGPDAWFTFYRDPIDRFLSGYHEIMRRKNETVPMERSKEHLGVFLQQLVSGQMKEISSTRFSEVMYGPVECSVDMLEALFCGRLPSVTTMHHAISNHFRGPHEIDLGVRMALRILHSDLTIFQMSKYPSWKSTTR